MKLKFQERIIIITTKKQFFLPTQEPARHTAMNEPLGPLSACLRSSPHTNYKQHSKATVVAVIAAQYLYFHEN